jgi:predicted Zn-dependent peptidase
MNKIKQRTLQDGVHFRSVQDTKFKTFRISVNFLLPLKQETAAANALIPFLLSRCSSEYPDFTQMSRKMASLYGASLSSDVGKLGDMQVLTLTASAIADRYALHGEALTAQLTQVLCGAIFSPALEDGLFREDDFRQEQRQTLEQIDADYNDKRIYALLRCTQIMCAGESFGISRYGSREDVEKLTRRQVTAAWENMLRTARVEILVMGDVDPEPAAQVFSDAFHKIERCCQSRNEAHSFGRIGDIPRVTEHQDVTQGKMVLGLRTSASQFGETELVPATRLMSTIYGGTPNGKLFLNVREKLSLCYYCSSAYNSAAGLMFVQSGVQFQNMKKAEQAILEQLDSVKDGCFTDDDIAAAKLSMVNNYHTVGDSLPALDGWYLSQSLAKIIYTPEEYADMIGAVTREQIVKAAASVRLDAVYCLMGQKEGNAE